MSDEKFKIDADATGYVNAIEASIKSQLQLAQSQEKLISTVTTLNNNTGIYSTKLKTLNSEGNTVTRTFESMGSKIDWVGEKISNVSQAQSRFANQVTSLKTKNDTLKTSLTGLTKEYSALHATATKFYKESQKKIDSTTYKKATTEIKSLQKTVTQANNAIIKMNTVLNNQSAALKKYQAQLSGANKSGKKFSLTMESIVKLASVSVAMRFISEIEQALVSGIKLATEYSTRLAEINTIADISTPAMEALSSQIKAVSNSFGFDRLDVAEASYQALSKQIVSAATAEDFLAEAAKFARTGVTSLTTAVSAASAVMNVYNIDITRSEEVFAKMLATVKQGSLRAEDFNKNFGRTLALGKAVGLGFEEISSQLATMTNKGLDAAAAQSQMRALYTKLLKPTKALKAVYASVGAVSAENIITTRKWAGMIELLHEKSGGLTSELAEMLSRQRAITSAVTQTGVAQKTYADNLELITGAQENYNAITERFMNSTGPKAVVTWNAIGNAMLDVADDALEVTVATLDFLAGALPRDRIAELAALKKEYKSLGIEVDFASMGIVELFLRQDELTAQAYVASQSLLGQKNALKEITNDVGSQIKSVLSDVTQSMMAQNQLLQESLSSSETAYTALYKTIKSESKLALKDLKKDSSDSQRFIDKQVAQIEKLKAKIASSVPDVAFKEVTSNIDVESKDINETLFALQTLEEYISDVRDTAGDAKSITELENSFSNLGEAVDLLNTVYGKLDMPASLDADKLKLEAREALLETLESANEEAEYEQELQETARTSLKEQLETLEKFTIKKAKNVENDVEANKLIWEYSQTAENILSTQESINETYLGRDTLVNALAEFEKQALEQLEFKKIEALNRELKGIEEQIDLHENALKERNKQITAQNELISSQETYVSNLRTELGLLRDIQAARGAFGNESSGAPAGFTDSRAGTTIDQSSTSSSSSQTINFNTQISRSDATAIAAETSRQNSRR